MHLEIQLRRKIIQFQALLQEYLVVFFPRLVPKESQQEGSKEGTWSVAIDRRKSCFQIGLDKIGKAGQTGRVC